MKSLYLILRSCFVCVLGWKWERFRPLRVPSLLRWKVAVVPSHPYRFLLYLLPSPFLLLWNPNAWEDFPGLESIAATDKGLIQVPQILHPFFSFYLFWVLGLNLVFMLPRWFFSSWVFCVFLSFWFLTSGLYHILEVGSPCF